MKKPQVNPYTQIKITYAIYSIYTIFQTLYIVCKTQ